MIAGNFSGMSPKLAVLNLYEDVVRLKEFALEHGFSGIDWSFELETIPVTPLGESKWVKAQSLLQPLEVRYHCPFSRVDLGHIDPVQSQAAGKLLRRVVNLVSRAGGRYLSIHLGLGMDSTEGLSWERSIDSLRDLVHYGAEHRVRVCLENLAWGWTSRPNLFEKLIRRSGAWVTLDMGHAFVCESVASGYYSFKDFVTPHPDRIMNAHVYHKEIQGQGHIPPSSLDQIEERLMWLGRTSCTWWVLEIKDVPALLRTKEIVDQFFVARQFMVPRRMNSI